MTTLKKQDAKWYSEMAGETFVEVYQTCDADSGDGYTTLLGCDDGSWIFCNDDRRWDFANKGEAVRFARRQGFEIERPEQPKETPRVIEYAPWNLRSDPYSRTRARVYATGNRWAIENFNATHN